MRGLGGLSGLELTLWMLALVGLAACGGEPSAAAGDVQADALPAPDGSVSSDARPADATAPSDGPARLDLTVEPVVVELGRIARGQLAEADFVVRNSGDAALTITAFDGLAAPFSLSREAPLPIGVDQSRTLVVQFEPDAAGAFEQVVTLVTEPALGVPVTLTFRGEGVAASATLVTPTVDFGVVAPGEPTSRPLQVRNDSADVTLSILSLSGLAAPFETANGQVVQDVAPGQTAQIVVQFAPAQSGDFEQQVVVSTTAGDFTALLRGRAILRGDLRVNAVYPAWAPVDRATVFTIEGGPFDAVPRAIRVGAANLVGLERVDATHVRGTRPAGGEAARGIEDVVDVRVEVGAAFGVLTDAVTLTPPVGQGTVIDRVTTGLNDPAMPLGPEGGPDQRLTLGPGAVVLAPPGAGLAIEGLLEADGSATQIVLSTADETESWAGIELLPAARASVLRGVVLERAGLGGAAITTAQAAEVTQVRLWQSAGDAVRVQSGGTLVLINSRIDAAVGDGVVLAAPDATVFRFQGTLIQGTQAAFVGAPQQFGRAFGAGNLLNANAQNALVVRGAAEGDATLANQPASLPYQLGTPDAALSVPRGASLTFAAAVQGALGGRVDIEAQTTLPAGLTLDAQAGAALRVRGPVSAQGTAEAPITLGGDAPWGGLTLDAGGRLEGAHLNIMGGPVRLNAAVAAFDGLAVSHPGEALTVTEDATLTRLSVTVGDVVLRGGTGTLSGIVAGAVRVEAPASCADWDLDGLVDAAGAPVVPVTVLPGEAARAW
jgi:hypothetical protein